MQTKQFVMGFIISKMARIVRLSATSLLSKALTMKPSQKTQSFDLHQKINRLDNVTSVSLAYISYDPEPTAVPDSPIVILHGLFGSKINWNTMARNLAVETSRRVIAVDARNHGESPHTTEHSYEHMAADVKSLVEELNFPQGRVSLVGHSMGGRTAMLFALMNPNMAKDLIVVDISPIGSLPHHEAYREILQALSSLVVSDSDTLAEGRANADAQLISLIDNQGLRKFLLSNLIKNAEEKFAWKINLETLMKEGSRLVKMPEIKGVFDKPTLFVCGGRSNYMSPNHIDDIKKIFPKAKIEWIKEAGHLVHAEYPELFLQIASNFLKENKENVK